MQPEFEKPYFHTLTEFLRQAHQAKTVYPPPTNIFHAFEACPLQKTLVVILGQDPYHGKGQAHGLCFSVNDGIALPPSLQNIYKELFSDLGVPRRSSGNLDHWAKQGILLLNSTLTVEAGHAGSHQGRGWEEFTDAVIRTLAEQQEHIVFLLWGAYAQKKAAVIDNTKHLLLKSAHPSPFSATKFFGNKHFSKTNTYLIEHGKPPIIW